MSFTEEVFDILETKAEYNHVKWVFEKPYALIYVFSDVQRIEQGLINLALNAAHYAIKP